jgi:peptide/nickel transport system substrate-binding protein
MRSMRLNLAGIALALVSIGVIAPAVAAPSKYGGTLTVALGGGDPDTLDPSLSHSISSQQIYQAICWRLYGVAPDGKLVPRLAAAPPALSQDKLSYSIQLRQGIQFNDGTPMNAQAVVVDALRGLTVPNSDGIVGVTAAGPYTVVYHLSQRNSAFVANPYVESPTAEAAEGANFGANPVCAGPFMFDHRVVGDNVTVIKSPYWYQRTAVHLDKIVFKPFANAVAAAAALEAGDVQVIDNVATTEVAGLQENAGVRVIQTTQFGWSGLIINMGNRNGVGSLPYSTTGNGTALSTSPLLRQAFEEAIDRKTLSKVALGGLVQPDCHPISTANTLWSTGTAVPCTPYDPADAKKLVAKSGVSNPTVDLLVPNTTDRLNVAQFIQSEEAAVGIHVVIDPAETAAANARALAGNFDVYYLGHTTSGSDPGGNFNDLFTTDSTNYGGYSNPRMDFVLANALKATSPTARKTYYRVAEQIIQKDRPIIVLYHLTTYAAYSTSVTGVQLQPASGNIQVAYAQYK